jgi:hypothetical protein
MAHLHTDMERLDIHVALEVCEIVIESATLVPIVFALSGLPIYVAHSSNQDDLNEKLTHFHQYLVEFRCVHLSNRVKNDPAINVEKALRTNEALVGELSVFEIGTIQGNGESIEVRAAGDLAENQIRAWKIVDHQSRPALPAGSIGPRKSYDNNFAGYRFDHAASSSGEFQSSARTDSLNSAPLNASSRAFLFKRIVKS